MTPRDTVARVAPIHDDAPARDAPVHDDAPARDAPARDAAEPGLRALGRDALARAEREQPSPVLAREPAPPVPESEAVRPEDNTPAVDLARMAWLVTVLACLLAVAILVLQGYVGYAGVTLAVAVAAAINLL
jgi:hypothetical protein